MPNNGLSRGEKWFVGGVFVVVFVISVGFVMATEFWGYGFPATFVAISLGISIASLVYAFLGGVAGSEFSVISGIKIAGSAALIAIVFWLVAGPLEKNMNDVPSTRTADRRITTAMAAPIRISGQGDAKAATQPAATRTPTFEITSF